MNYTPLDFFVVIFFVISLDVCPIYEYLHSAVTSRGGIFSEGSLGALTERRALGI